MSKKRRMTIFNSVNSWQMHFAETSFQNALVLMLQGLARNREKSESL